MHAFGLYVTSHYDRQTSFQNFFFRLKAPQIGFIRKIKRRFFLPIAKVLQRTKSIRPMNSAIKRKMVKNVSTAILAIKKLTQIQDSGLKL